MEDNKEQIQELLDRVLSTCDYELFLYNSSSDRCYISLSDDIEAVQWGLINILGLRRRDFSLEEARKMAQKLYIPLFTKEIKRREAEQNSIKRRNS